jgi:hypothetical protein
MFFRATVFFINPDNLSTQLLRISEDLLYAESQAVVNSRRRN